MTGKLIGIGGKLASGKDTVADFLVESRGWVKLNMSGPLHDAALALNPWIQVTLEDSFNFERKHSDIIRPGYYTYQTLTEMFGYTTAKEVGEYRAFLQRLGTEVGRDMFDKNLWVNIASKHISQFRQQGYDVVITGIRFPNEFEMIRNNRDLDGNGEPGLLLWVKRPSLELNASNNTPQHASEQLDSDGFDLEINNNGTLEELYNLTDALVADRFGSD